MEFIAWLSQIVGEAEGRISQGALAREMVGEGAPSDRVQSKRAQITKWMRGRPAIGPENAQQVLAALDRLGVDTASAPAVTRPRRAATPADDRIEALLVALGAGGEGEPGLLLQDLIDRLERLEDQVARGFERNVRALGRLASRIDRLEPPAQPRSAQTP